jgi:Mu transposase, C-terminal
MNDRNDLASPPPALTLMRVLTADGIVIKGLRYQSADLQTLRLSVAHRSVKVRVDLLDIRRVFVWSGSHWICARVHSVEATAGLFRQRSSKQPVRLIEEICAASAGDDCA